MFWFVSFDHLKGKLESIVTDSWPSICSKISILFINKLSWLFDVYKYLVVNDFLIIIYYYYEQFLSLSLVSILIVLLWQVHVCGLFCYNSSKSNVNGNLGHTINVPSKRGKFKFKQTLYYSIEFEVHVQ